MSVSLTSPTSASSNRTRTFYVPAWRYAQYRQHDRGTNAARSISPPRTSPLDAPSLHSTMPVTTSRLPIDMPRDPRLWSRENVHEWLSWCQEEFDLPVVDVNQFPMNGKAMCLLMKSDFNDRAPRAGDVLYNAIHLLLLQVSVNDESQQQRYQQQLRIYTQSGGSLVCSNNAEGNISNGLSNSWPFVSSDYHNLGQVIHQSGYGFKSGNRVEGTVTLSPAPSIDSQSSSPRQDDGSLGRLKADSANEVDGQRTDSFNQSESGGSDSETPPPTLSPTKNKQNSVAGGEVHLKGNNRSISEQPVTNGRLLWDFLHQLLNDEAQRYSLCIAWKERETGVFKIVDPHGLAQLWGMQKNHLNMNFDKMSRALRYYYRVNILKKVQGERHCYQFLRQPMELKACKQRALLNKYTCRLPSKQSDQESGQVHIKREEEV